MPNMDGLQSLSQLKASEAWMKVPVVMVSTEGSQAKVLEAVEKGAVGYVRKPFTAEQIKENSRDSCREQRTMTDTNELQLICDEDIIKAITASTSDVFQPC